MGIEPVAVSIPRSHPLSSGCCCAVFPEAAVPTTAGTTIGGFEVVEQDPLGLLVFY